ncbi:hypothetical protein E2R51_17490 [Jeotgalibacillus sp. S-D1]|uniref:staygreen family protein n=1 Tax=Jeotgalibacillus sp. S-D1 TaxID=2552189 RepID=UPI0010594CCF|nr:staygreen family protein [Jeotgalibacillus sp. S-D1]TDL30592.1 hypothetical protein E2R51_17490 [Jeotgalibacillus sp. S-D1]
MKKLDPSKLFVEFRPGVMQTEPIIGRKYTLTHSDVTANLFLTIGLEYAADKITAMRDEVLAEWRIHNSQCYLWVYVYVGGQNESSALGVRNAIFRREMPLALEAIRYGDGGLFSAHPPLDFAPIWIHFDSTDPVYNKIEKWGRMADYR